MFRLKLFLNDAGSLTQNRPKKCDSCLPILNIFILGAMSLVIRFALSVFSKMRLLCEVRIELLKPPPSEGKEKKNVHL